MSVAAASAPEAAALARAAFAALPVPAAVRLWDGTRVDVGAPGRAAFVVAFTSAAAFQRLVTAPSPLAFAEAVLAGAIDLEGDLFAAAEAAHRLEDLLPAGAAPAAAVPPADAAGAIAFHYDLPAAFYALFLDPRMVYTCAYWRDPAADLEAAQAAKLDLVCRKLALAPGERFLDLGCGWGGLVVWAAERWGATVHGVTLSARQAAFAADAIARAGLGDRATVEHLDWRALPAATRADKIAAVGLAEHVGPAGLPAFFARVRALLVPGGLVLNQSITIRAGTPHSSEMEFLHRHVFPGGALGDLSGLLAAMEGAGLEILDVHGLRADYARTTRVWAERLQANAEAACALVGARTFRTWLLYLAGASAAFAEGAIGLYQVLAVRPAEGGARVTLPARVR